MTHYIETAAIHGEAWHDVGKRLDHLMTVEEALEESGLGGWMLHKFPAGTLILADSVPQDQQSLVLAHGGKYFEDWSTPEGRVGYYLLPLDDTFGHVRTKDWTLLGSVGKDYASIDNEFGFSVFKMLCDKNGLNIAKIQSAGSLKGGKRVWVLLSLPDSGFTIGNRQDQIIPYLLYTGSHDGTAASQFLPTTVNVVCWNTLNAAMGEAYAALNVKVRHTGDIEAKMEDVQNMMAQAAMMFGDFERIGNELDDRVVTQEAFGEVMNFLFPPLDEKTATNRMVTNRNAKIMLLTSAIKEEVALLPQFTQTGEGGFSYWTLLNGITRFTTHKQVVRIGQNASENDARFESQVLGPGAEFNARATGKIMELAEVK
jgi:phage/plasmid-like protein (TIGR03299 family)